MGDPQIVVQRLTPNATSTHEQRQPSRHLLSRENSNLYLNNCVPLYKAALKGDWKSAKKLLEKDPTMLCASITKGHETVIHIAAGARQTGFVEELMKLMQPKDLTLPDQKGNTAFCCAAAAGATEIAKVMLKKNPSLLTIRGGEKMMPIFLAALLAQGEMTSFLYNELSQAKHVFQWEDEIALFFTCLTNGLYDLAFKMLKDDPELAVARDENSETALHVLARKPSICSSKNQDKDQQNNMLHLAAKLPHPSRIGIVPGAALQMQRELLWFKEIEKIVLPSFREKKNLKGQTPQELFTQEHGELLKSGEQWMKNTATSCILVATIITTIIFASVFSVPGGNDSSKRLPIHLKKTWFQVFVISDAIALSSSSISVLMFLLILTSRYTEDNFLESLPFKLMVGLSTLFVSVITMMIAFSMTILLAYHDRLNCVIMLTTVVVSTLATLCVLLQYPLLLGDVFCSTYYSRFLFKPSKSLF